MSSTFTLALCDEVKNQGDEKAMENIARYIVRASFSQERMTYLPDESKVVYRSKDRKTLKSFDALEWLAAMCSHVPNKGEQMVRYYGYYSNVSRGKRKKQNEDDWIPCILEQDKNSKEYRKNWARLIQKIGACPGLDPGRLTPFAVPNARVGCVYWLSSRMKRSSRRSSNTWDYGKCNPDPHPLRPRSGPSSPSPISIIQPALVRLVCLSWRVTIHYPKRDFLSIRCW